MNGMTSGLVQDAIDVFVNVEAFSSEGEFDHQLPDNFNSSSSESDLDDLEREGNDTKYDVADGSEHQLNALASEFDWDKYGTMNELQEQVQNLQSGIENKDSMIDSLNDTIASLRQELTSALSSDAHECALDVTQKNRALRLSLTRATAENARLTAQVQQFREIIGANSEVEKKPAAENEVELKQWKSKYKAKSARLASAELQISALKNEILSLKRVLKAEIGSDEGVEKALSGTQSNWRGRAAEIARLSAKLKQHQRRTDAEGVDRIQHSQQSSKPSPKYDATKMQQERNNERDQLINEVMALRQLLAAMKTRCEAGVARNRTLEEQVVSVKAKMKIIIDKSCADDKLIDTLKAKIKQGACDRLLFAKLQQEISMLQQIASDYEHLRVEYAELKNQLETQKSKISLLESHQAQLVQDLFTDWDRRVAEQQRVSDQLDISNLERCLDLSRSAHARLEQQFKRLNSNAEWLKSELLKTSRGKRLSFDQIPVNNDLSEIKPNGLELEIVRLRESWHEAKQLYADGLRQLQERAQFLQDQLNITRDISLQHN